MLSKEFIQNYKKLVTLIKNYDQANNNRRFGSEEHQYQLRTPVPRTPQNLKILNDKAIPRDYVDYMFNIANGGFSRDYGLLSLDKVLYYGLTKAAEDEYIDEIVTDDGNREPSKDDVYISIEHQGCGNYTLLKISGKNAGCIASDYGGSCLDFIKETNMSFKLYLLSPFFEDANFLDYLKADRQYAELYKFLMCYQADYKKVIPNWL